MDLKQHYQNTISIIKAGFEVSEGLCSKLLERLETAKTELEFDALGSIIESEVESGYKEIIIRMLKEGFRIGLTLIKG